ncbi:hypothetical protein CPB86DRAFT_333980 [Serendipita vermifera]|nr:hypothetical protein CPB86DRAFT_333980 [Serendipita vermifera]
MSYWTSGVRRARELGDKAREHLKCARPCSCIGQSKTAQFETDQVLVKLEECVPVDTRDQTEPQPSSLDNHNSVAHHSTNDPIDPVPHDSPQEPQTSTVKDYFHNPLERTTSPDSIVHRPPRKRAVLIGIHYYEEKDGRWEKLDVPGKDVEKVEALLRKCTRYFLLNLFDYNC